VSEAQNEWNWFTWEDLWEGKVEAGGDLDDLVWWLKLRLESGIHELQSVFMVGVMLCSLIRSFYRVIPFDNKHAQRDHSSMVKLFSLDYFWCLMWGFW
jgi:hypothetical protein